VVWLAVLAVVAQTVLFDLAMAARATAAARERVELARHAQHGTPQDGQSVPAHEHSGKDCPFCIARAMHQAPSLPPSVVLPPPSSVVATTPYLPRRRVRAHRRPTRFHSRSPPRLPRHRPV
jgi:hypothetical protein